MTIHINTANMPLSLPPCKSRSANTGSDALNIFLEWVMLVCQHSQHVGGRSQSLLVQGKPRVRFILDVKCSVAIVVSVNAYVNKHFIALSFQIRFVINKRLYALCHRKKYACFISVVIYTCDSCTMYANIQATVKVIGFCSNRSFVIQSNTDRIHVK